MSAQQALVQLGLDGLELDGLAVHLSGREVLSGITLDVGAGELVVLAGPSGSGKSTLLRAVAGLLPVNAGEIRIGGERVNEHAPGRRGVAMVFQSYALFPHLRVRDNLAFGLRARGTTKRAATTQVEEAAAALELTPLLDRWPRELSGGERQRVALARALLRHPQVFLMDEPLSNLDAPLRARARAEILRLHRRLNAATLYVTHDQAEALALADRLGILRDGRLEQLAKPLEVYRRPRNLFVARFIGNPAMNVLDVHAAPPDAVLWRDQRLSLPERMRTALQAGRTLKLGVRAEHVHPFGSRWTPGGLESAPRLRARLERIEAVGDQSFLWLDADGNSLAARVEPGFEPRPGDMLELALDPAGLHLFDAQTEEALA